MAVPANPDWSQGRFPLPILFAHVIDHPERSRFAELRARAEDPEALAEAQPILIRCGAVGYCVNELLRRYEEGGAMMEALPLPRPDGLRTLMEETVAPIWRLLRAAVTEGVSVGPTPEPAEAK